MKCKKSGCPNEVTVDLQVYCSRECAPYGHLSDPRGRLKANKKGGYQRYVFKGKKPKDLKDDEY